MNRYHTLASPLLGARYQDGPNAPFLLIPTGTKIVNGRFDHKAHEWRCQAWLDGAYVGIRSHKKPDVTRETYVSRYPPRCH